ncbi:MAG: Phytanoyl-CoA dioxygenase [uncultured Thiotrichaceae bacterium]|uniref:Phytanoyl-CoA dioxygenase n=1 Tax=uncultured Thiotrichaceae bacterium TaxID=298394 RepID=A0A6S6U089_9GAMM|nr:MAG: Phytanoyl-CoA dioxygenase [uncultured Thiotrichaceae bacterium]
MIVILCHRSVAKFSNYFNNLSIDHMNTVKEIAEIHAWKKMNPRLSITETPFLNQPADFKVDADDATFYLNSVVEEGYLKAESLIPAKEVELIAEAIEKIVALGLPPVFIYVYDEVWQVFKRLSELVVPILDKDYKITIAGMWAWRIGVEEEGFSIHRDIYAKDTRADGRPAHLTVWIPFTDATPHNSCMYMLPIHLDPNYPDNLTNKTITNYSDIRALPAKAGSVVAWNANIAHWGSKSSKLSEHPRISIAMDFSCADADMAADDLAYYASGPDLNIDKSAPLTFTQRLNAIGESMWFYKNRIRHYHSDKADLLFQFCQSYSITQPEINLAGNHAAAQTQQNTVAQAETPVEAATSVAVDDASTLPVNSKSIRLMPARKCVVKNCDGQGFGVYAKAKIAAKELIEECHLMPAITQDVFDSCTTTFPITNFVFRTANGEKEHVVALGFADNYRHSGHNFNAAWIQHETARALQFYALRDIKPGEEIRINYAMGKSGVQELVPPGKVEVRESPDKGFGVFAIEDISVGEVIEDCRVQHLGEELSTSDAFSDYRFNYPKGVGSKKRVLAMGLGGVFNHADENNAYWINHPFLDNVFRYMANRNIKAGEEVCTSYGGSNYWAGQGIKPV